MAMTSSPLGLTGVRKLIPFYVELSYIYEATYLTRTAAGRNTHEHVKHTTGIS